MNNWIDINDKLPEHEKDILFVDEYDVIHKGYLTRHGEYLTYDTSDRYFGLDSCEGVTYWMPLPELPFIS